MVGMTQNKQMPYFHCGPQKNSNNKKSKKGVSESFKDSKTTCEQEQYKLISSTDNNNYDNKQYC